MTCGPRKVVNDFHRGTSGSLSSVFYFTLESNVLEYNCFKCIRLVGSTGIFRICIWCSWCKVQWTIINALPKSFVFRKTFRIKSAHICSCKCTTAQSTVQQTWKFLSVPSSTIISNLLLPLFSKLHVYILLWLGDVCYKPQSVSYFFFSTLRYRNVLLQIHKSFSLWFNCISRYDIWRPNSDFCVVTYWT